MRTSGLQWNREKKKHTHTHTKTNKKRILRQTWENTLRTVFGKWAICHSDYQAAANTKSPFYSYRWKQGWS